MSDRKNVSCGLDLINCPDINTCLTQVSEAGYEFTCLPIVNPCYQREFIENPACDRNGPITRSDMVLSSQDWSSLIVAKLSPWIQTDSSTDFVRKNSELALKEELNFASHLGVPAVLIPLKEAACQNKARIIYEHILSGHNHQYWVQVPIRSPSDQCDDLEDKGDGDAEPVNGTGLEDGFPKATFTEDTWAWWDTFRTACEYSKKLGISLELAADLPSSKVLERWLGEPIKSVIIPTAIFLTNKKGFPVLGRCHQNFIKKLFKLDVQIIISGMARHADKGYRAYQQYLEHLWQTREPLDNVSQFAKGYEDYLQCPLQPLMDNLESQTYEVFEKDPVKYSQYQRAVYSALLDRVPEEEKDSQTVIIMVLGAGRGPLVNASLNAAKQAMRNVKVYAVEKNPNAIVTLLNFKDEMWGDKVTVVSSDMRVWKAPEKADIIVSELLGSFGDNELSPECLDGGQMHLKEDGISIPSQYTSYIAPLTSSKLWNEVKLCKMEGKPPEAVYETPYVVRLHNVCLLDQPQPLFTFYHPNKGVIDNNRYEIRDFHVECDATMHGFAGYFDCVLYGDINLSIVPQTHSPGMFSWFPMFIPIKEPMHLQCGDKLTVHFWRRCSPKHVWYEWCVSSPYPKTIHNPKGRSYQIGL